MTLRQKRFLKLLPENNFNVSLTMKKAGYTTGTSLSGTQHRRLQKITTKIYDIHPQEVKKRILEVYEEIHRKKDFTNANRNLELQAKIANIIKTDVVAQQIVFTDAEISELKDLRKSISSEPIDIDAKNV